MFWQCWLWKRSCKTCGCRGWTLLSGQKLRWQSRNWSQGVPSRFSVEEQRPSLSLPLPAPSLFPRPFPSVPLYCFHFTFPLIFWNKNNHLLFSLQACKKSGLNTSILHFTVFVNVNDYKMILWSLRQPHRLERFRKQQHQRSLPFI